MSNGPFDSDGIKEFLDVIDVDSIDGKAPPPRRPSSPSPEDLKGQIESMKAALATSTDMVSSFQNSANNPDQIQSGLSIITKELASLLEKSNSLVDHCKYCIESTELLDGEMVSAVAGLISSTRDIISQFTVIFRDRVKFLHACELEALKLKNKKEFTEHFLQLKAKYDPKNIEPDDAEEAAATYAYRQEDVVKQIVCQTLKVVQSPTPPA